MFRERPGDVGSGESGTRRMASTLLRTVGDTRRAVTIRVPFNSLSAADLVVGAIYEGGTTGNASDDPMARLLPCGNQGGFRIRGQRTAHSYRMALLYTSGANPDWPDALDPETGLFTYFGDNKQPGSQLHDTRRGGNELLRFAFGTIHADPPARHQVPPFFVFRKATPGPGRDVEFLGLAVPGGADVHRSTTSSRSGAPRRDSASRTTTRPLPCSTSLASRAPGSPSSMPA